MSRLSSLLKPRLFSSKSVSSRGGANDWRYRIRKLAFNLSQYNRYGLYTDDVYNLYSPLVEEALRRLPKDVMDARNFRYPFKHARSLTVHGLSTNFRRSSISFIRIFAAKSNETMCT